MLDIFIKLFDAERNVNGCLEVRRDRRPYVYIGSYQGTLARLICIEVNGDPPDPNCHASHICANNRCIEPAHIRWLSPTENYSENAPIQIINAKSARNEAIKYKGNMLNVFKRSGRLLCWYVNFRHEGKRYFKGYFYTPEEAADWRNTKYKELGIDS